MNEREIFMSALNIDDPHRRIAYLDDACGDDAELRERVDALLDSHESAGSFLDGRAELGEVTADLPPITEKPGTEIGPYKLLQQIGEGGMGVVYMAEQNQPVKRRVALKIIKPGMDTKQVIARFEVERQALAMMDHPNIAKVLDAGTTDSGRPYFIMELVNGIPITKYCDEQHLTPRERLELLIPICQSIQHAHQKGIIHRDLKPSNVLIALYDGRAVPKVIDFGVAKATSRTLTEKTLFTQLGQIVGTLEYMSPEQAQRNQLDIDTRSDIYSLGVLLYELLTGTTPFDPKRLRSAALDEMMRIIREEEPPRPSTRLSSSDTLPSVAASRHIEPRKLSTLVRGELDWIVMKALEKDRARRYETATGFANDIQRYLNDEPVVACPPSTAYKFRKFARRNKVAFATGSMVAAAVVLGLIGTTWQMIRATRAESRAETQANKARSEAAISQAVNDFINKDVLSQANPFREPNRDIKLRTVVDRAADTIAERFEDQPLVKAAIHLTLGETYKSLGEYEKAERHCKQSVEIRRRVLGKLHRNTLNVMNNLANVFLNQGRYAEAEKLHGEVLAIKKRVLGTRHPDTLLTMNNLANVTMRQGRYADSERLFREVLEIMKQVQGPEHPHTINSMNNLANAMQNGGRYADAEVLYREVLAIDQRVGGPEHPDTLGTTYNLALVIYRQGRYEQAEKMHREVWEIRKRVLGPKHPQTLDSMNHLASVIRKLRPAEAEPLCHEVLELRKQVLGPNHPSTLDSMGNLASAFMSRGRFADAERMYVDVVTLQKQVLGPKHPRTLMTMHNRACAIRDQGRYGMAEKLYGEVLEMKNQLLGPDHPETLRTVNSLARSRRAAQQAVELAREATELQPNDVNHRYNLGFALYQSGDWKAAVEALEKADGMPSRDHDLAMAHRWFLAMAYWQLKDRPKARRCFGQAAAWLDEKNLDTNHQQYGFLAEAEQLMGIDELQREALVKEGARPSIAGEANGK